MPFFGQTQVSKTERKITSARRRPRNRFRRRIRYDRLRGLSILLLVYVGLKATAVLALGPGIYSTKVAYIAANGSALDRFIAWAMMPDVATLKVAHVLANIGF